jgi:glyoxylase-like metal-dependent hydrolase (beta-lactamase superfamily II)
MRIPGREVKASTVVSVVAGMALLAAGGPAGRSVATVAAQPPSLRTPTLDISDNLYLLSGGGGNALMMTGDRGVVLADALSPGQGRVLLEMTSAISEQAITTVIYTHAHLDHTGSSRELPTLTEIVAHENTHTNMARMPEFSGPGTKFLPSTTFRDTLSIGDGRDRIDLHYFGAGHTNGDIVVAFPAKRTALVGDLFPGKRVPVVDAANGGSFVAWPETLARAVAALKGITRIIPGHGLAPPGSPLGRWITMTDLQEYANFTRDFLAQVEVAFKGGKTIDEAVSGLALAERYPAYDLDGARPGVQAIYAELKQRR